MRLNSLLPFIALLGLTACDSAKVAELTGAKPAATASPACTTNPLPACAPGQGAAPGAMAPEGAKGAAPAGTPAEAATASASGEAETGVATDASAKAADDHFAAGGSAAGASRVNTAYAAASHRHTFTHRAVRRVHVVRTRKVIVVRKNYYIHDTRYVTVDRPVYQPPQVVYPQPRQTEVYVDREIDRTSSAYGRQVYNRYSRSAAPPVVYHGLYRQDQRVYTGVRQDGYAYQQSGYGYQSGSAYRYGSGYSQGYQGGAANCQCGAPAAGRDRAGYLTWPGKTESRRY